MSTLDAGVQQSLNARTRWATWYRNPRWLHLFVVSIIVFQVGLLIVGMVAPFLPGVPERALRVPMRVGVFGGSLLLLLLIPRRGLHHPAATVAMLSLAWIGVSLFHPTTNSIVSGAAQVAMYLAILGPLFWVSRLDIDLPAFRRAVVILWTFHSLSAALGVLQVTFPGFLQPPVSAIITARGPEYLNDLRITTASGARVFRPMGLTDTPGGAAMAGFYAILFGVGLLLTSRRDRTNLLFLGSMVLGAVCIYLSQVRVVLVLVVLCLATFAFIMAMTRQMLRMSKMLLVTGLVTVVGFAWAIALGGDTVTRRLATLIADRPDEVYQSNRGRFLEHTIEELVPRYPLGAGLGRWGMTNEYFGVQNDPDRGMIWVEIQWTGWVLDGGIPLVILSLLAVLAAISTAWRIARTRWSDSGGELQTWGALFVAYNVGILAVTFNSPIFISQGGLEFWLLNAALFTAGAAATARSRRSSASGSGRPGEFVAPGVPTARSG